jgi:hypothetical protein
VRGREFTTSLGRPSVWPRRARVLFNILVLLVATFVFVLETSFILPVNGWWFDELWSLWATDPSLSFADAFAHRIVYDTSPPLYYVALFWVRRLIADEQLAVLVLNLGAIIVLFATMIATSRKSKMVQWAVVAMAAFLCSGPVLRYVIEGRSYLMALAVAFSASWFCALAIEMPRRHHNLTMFTIVGVVAGLTHVYVALFCCCLTAGLVVLSYADSRRRDLLRPALALGLSAGIIIFVFIVWAMKFVDQTSWIELSYQSILTAYWYVRGLTLGSRLATIFFIILYAKGLSARSTRPFAIAFGSAWALFVLIPLLVSLVQPIIVGRYWLIGAPSLIAFIVFSMREFFRLRDQGGRFRLYWGGCLASLLFLVLTDVGSYPRALTLTSEKPIWKGAQIVSPLLQGCPVSSVHVNDSVLLFATAAHVSEDLFVASDASNTELLDSDNSLCPVLGWAEHLGQGAGLRKDDEELLNMLKIGASPSAIDIRRHESGFVVLKRRLQF